ncbi:hypothetical protein J6590_019611 [Homalodisca vitripennis]|nr:hypothetical protein J6590_019611 [Homalodisca vitripennis]
MILQTGHVLMKKQGLTALTSTLKSLKIVEASRAEREMHTRQGMHLYAKGKQWLAEQIITAIQEFNLDHSISRKQTAQSESERPEDPGGKRLTIPTRNQPIEDDTCTASIDFSFSDSNLIDLEEKSV